MQATGLRKPRFPVVAVWWRRVNTSVLQAQDANITSEDGFCRLLPLLYGAAPPYSRQHLVKSAYSSSLLLISTNSNRLGYTRKPDLCPGEHKPYVEFVALVWKV